MNTPFYDPGQSPPEVLYDAALLLSFVADYVGLDPASEFFQVLQRLNRSAWEALPEVLTLDFRDAAQ